jgi:hypothetical protein
MSQELATTNLLLGIMAAVSVLEALVCIGIAIAAFIVYRRVMTLLEGVEQRQVAPAMARVNSILDDVKGVTTTVKQETERVDHAIRSTLHRVDDTADRVRSNVRVRTSRVIGLIRGIRVAIQSMLEHPEPRTHEPL